MCGIAGYYGSSVCEEVLLDYLEKLEYRGYDSSGIAVKNNDGSICVTKGKYKINELKNNVKNRTKNSLGIAHTRWATHGKVTYENAHPHISNSGQWCIVHNGIIDNYNYLKSIMENDGVTFKSQTDSEVIAQLLEYKKVDNIYKFIDTISMLQGSYAICAINNFDNSIYFAKYKNPLNIAYDKNGIYFASDIICFNKLDMMYCVLNDRCFGMCIDNNLKVYDSMYNNIDIKYYNISNIVNNKTLLSFGTFMENEINEIPSVFKEITNNYSNNKYYDLMKKFKNKIDKIIIIGCGTSYHSGLIGAKCLQEKLKMHCWAEIASEFEYMEGAVTNNTLCVFVSQSGETADTLKVMEKLKDKCLAQIVMTNSTHSTMARLADVVLPVFAGPEIAVASTKAYNAQVMVFMYLAKMLDTDSESIGYKNVFEELDNIDIKQLYEIESLKNKSFDNMFVLGRGVDYYTALEASLKIREITYVNCSALPVGELKHGTLALISDNTLSFVIITQKSNVQKSITAINEICSRGGKVAVVSQFDLNIPNVEYYFKLPNLSEELMNLVSVVPFQIFALKMSLFKGLNPDKPRNLAKSVTVE